MTWQRSFVAIAVILLSANQQYYCNAEDYPLLYQPEMDNIDLEEYFKDEVKMENQIQCVLHEGPCDEVGRWLKARVPDAFMGNCKLCTPKQIESLPKIVTNMQERHPREYRQAVRKYIMQVGFRFLG